MTQDYKICPYCAETIKAEAVKCRFCHSILDKQGILPRIYRCKRGKMIAGVCIGISQYFGVPVSLVRLFFIITTLIGGWGILIYLCLCLLPTEREKSAQAEQNADVPRKKTGPIDRMVKFLKFAFFCILFLSVYLPVGLLLVGSLLFVAWGFGIPVFYIDIFRFSLIELGIPGIVVGIFASCLLLYLIVLWIHMVMRLHFDKKIFRCNIFQHLVLVLCLCTGILSSAGILFLGYEDSVEKTWAKEFSPEEKDICLSLPGDQWNRLGISLRSIELKSAPQKKMSVSFTARIRNIDGLSEKCVENLDVQWEKDSIFPKVKKGEKISPLSESSLEIVIPEGKNLKIGTLPPVIVQISARMDNFDVELQQGEFYLNDSIIGSSSIRLGEGYLNLENCVIKKMQVKSDSACIQADSVQFSFLDIFSESGMIECTKCKGEKWIFRSREAQIDLSECAGGLNIQDKGGRVSVYAHCFPEKEDNYLETTRGHMFVTIAKNSFPRVKITKDRGIVRNRLPDYFPKESDGTVYISAGNGHLRIGPEDR